MIIRKIRIPDKSSIWVEICLKYGREIIDEAIPKHFLFYVTTGILRGPVGILRAPPCLTLVCVGTCTSNARMHVQSFNQNPAHCTPHCTPLPLHFFQPFFFFFWFFLALNNGISVRLVLGLVSLQSRVEGTIFDKKYQDKCNLKCQKSSVYSNIIWIF